MIVEPNYSENDYWHRTGQRYVPAAATNVAETIRRARLREQRREYVGEFGELVRAARLSDFVRVD